MTKASYFGLQNQIVDFHHGLLVEYFIMGAEREPF